MAEAGASARERAPVGRPFAAYLAVSLAGHTAWEIAQLPLYTLFRTEPPARIAFDVAHCTVGDLLIATSAALVALLVLGGGRWPLESRRFLRVAAACVALGVAYTAYSEWTNAVIGDTWTYAAAMPLVPPLGIGLTPLLQWLVIPPLALLAAARRGAAVRDEPAASGGRRNWKGTTHA